MPSAAALASAMTAGIAGEATAAGGGVVLEGGKPNVAAAGPGFELSAEFGSGLLFALGLGFSGMAHATKVRGGPRAAVRKRLWQSVTEY